MLEVLVLDFDNHAYLKVSKDKVTFKPTGFSYQTKDDYYLEEDCDGSSFVKDMKAKGFLVQMNTKNISDYSHDWFEKNKIKEVR